MPSQEHSERKNVGRDIADNNMPLVRYVLLVQFNPSKADHIPQPDGPVQHAAISCASAGLLPDAGTSVRECLKIGVVQYTCETGNYAQEHL